MVLYQNDFVSNLINRDGGGTKINGVNANPYGGGAYLDPNDSNKIKFFTVDFFNNRILIYNSMPTSNASLPDIVVGQADFVSNGVQAGGALSAYGLQLPRGVTVCPDGKMFIADTNNHRVLGYNRIPTTSYTAADFVIGQINMTTNSSGTTANKLKTPTRVHCIGSKFFISDQGNHRFLIYNTIPSANNPTADVVIGQPDMVTGTSACSATGTSSAWEALYTGSQLLISDAGNSRVLIYNSIPTVSNPTPDAVLGQADLVSCSANRGGAANADTLSTPRGLAIQNGKVAVADVANNRILFFTTPLTTGQSASYVLGQANFTTVTAWPVSATKFRWGHSIHFDGSFLWIHDYNFYRALRLALPY